MKNVLHFKSFLLLFFILGASNLFGQETLIKDINSGSGWSDIQLEFRIGNQFYFTANGDLGEELWVSDGTIAGTVPLKDIDPDPFEGSSPENFIEFNGQWFFTANDSISGRELWTTDGSTDGTVLFIDINAGAFDSNPSDFVILNNTLYFSANNGTNGKELWKSDGTVSGTVLVADVFPGISGSNPEFMTTLGSDIVFVANDGTNGKEIWKTDGTPGGTSLIKDIFVGASSSFPTDLTSVADKVYFIASDGINGKEIWRTDGTELGTVLTEEIVAGPGHPEANSLNAVGNYLFFVADDGTNGVELFRSDATAAPAIDLVEIFPDTFGSTPSAFIMLNGDMLFNANSGIQGFELWKANGSDGSVEIVKDILPGFESSSPQMLEILNGELIFQARGEDIGIELWKTDGTEAGTILLGDLNTDPSTDLSDSDPQLPVIKDNILYFTATDYINGYQIWRTDGTNTSTQRVTSIPHDTLFNNSHKPAFLNNIGNEVINFIGLTDDFGEELWGSGIDPVTISSIQTNSPLICNGDSNGTIDIMITGGLGDPSCFMYNWSEPGLAGLSLSGLSAGNYTITVTDCVGFETISTITIEEPMAVSASTQQTSSVSCNGGSDGQASVLGNGGTAPYNYLWDNAQTGPTVTGLSGGLHSVTITDVNQCTGVATVMITEPAPVSSSTTAGPIICFGANNGTAEVFPSGGTAPYTILWDNEETTSIATNLTGGNHTVTVTDANGCISSSSVNISSFAEIEIEFDVQHVSCINGSNGSATANPSGGSGMGYTFIWSTGSTNQTVTDLAAGNVCVTVTDDTGCFSESCITILAPEVSTSINNNVTCVGEANGSASVNILNPNSTYTYLWDNGETDATAVMLAGGMHTVTVTDILLCSTIETINITEPDAFVFSDSLSGAPSCFGGNNGFVSFNFSGGTMPYEYNWSTGDMTSTGTLGGLAGGATYCATITDAFECETFVFCSTIDQPEEITASLVNSADVSCFGICDGAATVEVTGGNNGMDLTFIWSSGEASSGISSSASALCAGENFVTITDGTCVIVESITIGGPDEIIPDISIVNISCNGAADGSVSATATGGTMPYDFEFSGGVSDLDAGSYSLTVTDANGCRSEQDFDVEEPEELNASFITQSPSCIGDSDGGIVVAPSGGTGPYSFEFSSDTSSLSAGTYSVTVTDANMCTHEGDFIIEDPSPVGILFFVTNNSCFGESFGSVVVDGTGGSGPYDFEFSGGTTNLAAGDYMVTATDANGCIGIDSFTITEPEELESEIITVDISCFGEMDGSAMGTSTGGTMPYTYNFNGGSENLGVGTYTVLTLDAVGCAQFDTFMISEPPLLVLAYTVTDASCFGANDGSIDITVSGGTAPYEFNDDYTELSAGVYNVLIMDANGCMVEESVTVGQPDEIVLTTSTTDATGTDADGTASVFAEGGNMPYTYEWDTDPVQTTDTATALVAGDYMVTVTDAIGCTSVETVSVGSFVNTVDLDESLRFNLFPNPTNANTTVYLEFTEVKDVDLKIYDALGRIIYQQTMDAVQNEQIELDTENFVQGIYWVHLNAGEGQYVRKLSVVR